MRLPTGSFAPVILTIALAVPLTGSAQNTPAVCRPPIDAQRKTVTTPHHLYSAETTPGRVGAAQTGEIITLGGSIYLRHRDKWRRSPMTPSAMLKQIDDNLADARSFSCRHVGTESVGGVAADVYTSHDARDGLVADARVWVARSSGLVLRIEEDLDTGGADGKRHISLRYDYANVRAPALGS
jgi:hypothetical protein